MSLPSISLAGRVAIVTGSSRGIGKGIARMFAEAGADVVVCSRNLDGTLDSCAAEIRDLGRRALAIPADVTDPAAAEALVQGAADKFGAVDVLVNNAGTVVRAPVVEHTVEDWDRVFDTNLKSYFLCSRAAARLMMQKKRGNIINIASMRGIVSSGGRVSYTVSKAGVIMLTKVMAHEFAPHNIRVNCIAPGWIKTELTRPFWDNPERSKEVTDTVAMNRWAAVEEMASAALFLASDMSSYVTGHTLVADGGIAMV